MSKSSMLTACSLGRHFAFVTLDPRLIPWFAGAFTPGEVFVDTVSVADDLHKLLIVTCRHAARAADVLVLAGAPIAKLAPSIREHIPTLPLDPLQAAVLAARQQFRRFPNGADRGSFQCSPDESATGPSAMNRTGSG